MRLLMSGGRSQRHNLATLAFLFLLALIALWFWRADPLRNWSLGVTDGFIPQEQGSESIVIVQIDDAALDAHGDIKSWSRSVHATAVERLSEAGARLIVYDLLFAEEKEGDDALRAAMEQARVLLTVAGEGTPSRGSRTLLYARIETPTPGLSEVAVGLGYADVLTDSDAVTRRIPGLVAAESGESYPALSVIAVERFFRPDERALPVIDGDELKLTGRTIPLDSRHNLRIAYAGNMRRFNTLSFLRVTEGDLSSADVAGKIVLIGLTAVGAGDYFVTPAGRMPGVLLQANAIDAILKGRFIREAALSPLLALGLAAAGMLSIVMTRRSLALGAGATVGVAVAYILASWLLPLAGWVIDPLYLPILLVLALVGSLVWRLVTAQSERLFFWNWFRRVAPPEMLRELERGGIEALHAFEVGELRLRRYLIVEELGSGTTGVVYKARDVRDGEMVAVKRLYPHLARNSQALERFRWEAQILRRLRSQHIVRLLDFVEDEEPPLLVMEYLPGGGLDGRLEREGPLAPVEAARLVAQAAQGLSDALEEGVLHRDIKPANILLSAAGVAQVTDFGLARMEDEGMPDATMPEGFVGTLRYASPEAAKGAVDARSDVYSLGLIFYELVTGQPAFQGSTAFEVEASRSQWILPDGTPFEAYPALMDVLERCLADDPRERFQHAGQVAEALRSHLTRTGAVT